SQPKLFEAAYGEAKRYPAKDFAALANLLAAEINLAAVVILGGPKEIQAAKATASFLRPELLVHNLAGQTNLYQALGILSHCRLLIANDSGLSHLAGALDVPTATLFGPTNPLTTGPLSRHSLVVREPVPCAPCRSRACPKKERLCFLGLTPPKVVAKILNFLPIPKALKEPLVVYQEPGPKSWPLLINALKVDSTDPYALEKFKEILTSSKNSLFFLGQDLNFLEIGQKLGAQTILIANPSQPKLFEAAYELGPTLAAPDADWGLAFILERLKPRGNRQNR
ncbi:MAG: glycosyltransferase family 9 protein, partial [Deltaproteobacteria bacterium]|nr:glycosyltransferase family 9 protein [Deltaproteobacteria bacterium]